MMKSVMGVQGAIQETELGFTLPHEHLFTDLSFYWNGEDAAALPHFIPGDKRSIETRAKVMENPWGYWENCVLDELECALHEAKAFQAYGGRTIVDLSPSHGMGRNPASLLVVAERTHMNVVMACGRYAEPSLTEAEKEMSVGQIEQNFLDEFEHGCPDLSLVKPGLLKVAFVDRLDKPAEIRSLRAAGRAQGKIGCALSIHPHIWAPDSHQILDILEEEGCDLRKVILCHQDYLGEQSDYLDSLAKRGVMLEFDTFGSGRINDRFWQQSESEKIGFLQQQIALGNQEHLLISGDMCLKIMLSFWGGAGLANIPRHVIPSMKAGGMDDEIVHLITVDNPRRVFCY